MEAYGPSHLAVIAIFLLGIGPVVVLGRRDRRYDGPSVLSRTCAVLIPLATVPFQIIDVFSNFRIGASLPLHLCDLAWIVAALALWTHHRFWVSLTFFWGLTLTPQAIITPALGYEFPRIEFFAFWVLHLLIVWAALYLVAGLGKVPTWRDYATTVATTSTWMVVVYVFDVVADTNYGYLREKPDTSILDFFGPWPVYLGVEIVLVSAIWALMTWLSLRLGAKGAAPKGRSPRGSRPTGRSGWRTPRR